MRKTPLGRWLNDRIEERHTTMRAVAQYAGLSHVTIFNTLHGQYNPSPDTCIKLARFFDVDPDILLEMAGHRPVKLPDDKVSFSVYLSRKFPGKPHLQHAIIELYHAFQEMEASSQ